MTPQDLAQLEREFVIYLALAFLALGFVVALCTDLFWNEVQRRHERAEQQREIDEWLEGRYRS